MPLPRSATWLERGRPPGRSVTGPRPTGSRLRSRRPAGRSSIAPAATSSSRRALPTWPRAGAFATAAADPSRRDSPSRSTAAVTVVATSDEATTERFPDDLVTSAPAGTQLIVVSDADEAPDQPSDAVEVVWFAAGLGPGAAANAGIRRAAGNVVVMLGEGSVQEGLDLAADRRGAGRPVRGYRRRPRPRVRRSADVGRRSRRGTSTRSARGWSRSGATTYVARGPLDERFQTLEALVVWWSLVLRDEGVWGAARRAVVPAGLTGGGWAGPDRGRGVGARTGCGWSAATSTGSSAGSVRARVS